MSKRIPKTFKSFEHTYYLDEEVSKIKQDLIHSILQRDYEIHLLQLKIDKATKDLQELIDKVNNKTIIGLNEFIPKLEIIQDELVGDKE